MDKSYIALIIVMIGFYYLRKHLHRNDFITDDKSSRKLAELGKRVDYVNLSNFLRYHEIRPKFIQYYCDAKEIKYSLMFEGGFKEYCFSTPTDDLIRTAFDWSKTPEGVDYWSFIDDLWRKSDKNTHYQLKRKHKRS